MYEGQGSLFLFFFKLWGHTPTTQRKKKEMEWTTEQIRAVELALSTHRLVLITGGPGTGKSSVLKHLCNEFTKNGTPHQFLAPTGTAARVVAKALGGGGPPGRNVMTIAKFMMTMVHDNEKFVVVIDEASMLTLEEWVELDEGVQAWKYILVGDRDQLKPVPREDGTACTPMFQALVNSGVVPMARLTRDFRQERGTALIENIHKLRAGGGGSSPFSFCTHDSSFRFMNSMEEWLSEWRRQQPQTEKKPLFLVGSNATRIALNARLQKEFNPKGIRVSVLSERDEPVHVGDPIICLENMYVRRPDDDDEQQTTTTQQLPVLANGAMGVMEMDDKTKTTTTTKTKTFVARFEGFHDTYDKTNQTFQSRFAPAYAITVTKSQGQSFENVVVVLDTTFVPSFEWFYTAISRASKQCTVIVNRTKVDLARFTTRSSFDGDGDDELVRALVL